MLFIADIVRIERAIGAGRQVANVTQGAPSQGFILQLLSGKSAEERAAIRERTERIFQGWRTIERIAVPYASEFFEVISTYEPIVYKGVSYNPLIGAYGENFNLIDFFGWVKEAGLKSIILNASIYAIINEAKTPLVEKYSERAAEDAVGFLLSKTADYPAVKESAKMRDRYLRAISLSLFPPMGQPLVVEASSMFQNKRYLECLQEAIAFCAGYPQSGERLMFRKYANYIRYNTAFQRWYSAFVLAEALYLNRAYGVNLKLGPTTESNFDSLIREFMKKLEIPYAFIWYDRGIEKQVAYPDTISFGDDSESIFKKLKNDKTRAWAEELVKPFGVRNGESLEAAVLRIAETVNRNSRKDIPPFNAEGEWFLTFPPGACD
ncbi:Uncharacterised protein [Candidatus Norongarragalina meridionalis]|nr:Uncharacterised protein [Candidatus Norongarragalina meridionalis]